MIIEHQINQQYYHQLKILKIYQLFLFLVKISLSKRKQKGNFLLGSSSSTKLCSRLIERYNQINYLYINDIANIDEDENIGKINYIKYQIFQHFEKHDFYILLCIFNKIFRS